MRPRLVRHPYTHGRMFLSGDVFFDLLREPLDTGFGMTAAFVDFLTEYAQCVHCQRAATVLEAHMACGFTIVRGRRKPLPARLRVPNQFAGALLDIAMVEGAKRRYFLRKMRARSAAGAHPSRNQGSAQIAGRSVLLLLRVVARAGRGNQRLNRAGDMPQGPLLTARKEGTNFINNIVLACVRCNSSKGERGGMAYLRERMKKASREHRAGLKRIYTARRKHPYHLVPTAEYLAAGLDFSGM